MPEQLVPVQVPFITVFTERMTPVGGVVGIAFATMLRQILATVHLPLDREDHQVFYTNIAVEEFVLFGDMAFQGVEVVE